MSVRSPEILDIRQELPPRLRAKAESVLEADEVLLAWFEPDLDRQLNFSPGLILLTDTRLISLSENDQDFDRNPGEETQPAGKAWNLSPEITLQAKEKGGASSLELVDCQGLVAQWRYTPAKSKAAHHFVDRWKLLRSGQPAESEASESTRAALPELRLAHQGGAGLLRELRIAAGNQAGTLAPAAADVCPQTRLDGLVGPDL